jgi:hypothetical protein
VAKDLIANDEGEISEVVRRRLFETLGPEKHRRQVATIYADWCFERFFHNRGEFARVPA